MTRTTKTSSSHERVHHAHVNHTPHITKKGIISITIALLFILIAYAIYAHGHRRKSMIEHDHSTTTIKAPEENSFSITVGESKQVQGMTITVNNIKKDSRGKIIAELTFSSAQGNEHVTFQYGTEQLVFEGHAIDFIDMKKGDTLSASTLSFKVTS